MTQNDLINVLKTVASDVEVMVIFENKLRTIDDISIVYKAPPKAAADAPVTTPPASTAPVVQAIVLSV